MKFNTKIFALSAVLALLATRSSPAMDTGELEAKAAQAFRRLRVEDPAYEEKYRAVILSHALALVDYLKKHPEAKDYLDALERLQTIQNKLGEEIPGKDAVIKSLIQRFNKQLKTEKDDVRRFSILARLIYLEQAAWHGDYDTMERLLLQKYDLAVKVLDRRAMVDEVFGERGIGNSLLNRYIETRDATHGLSLIRRMMKDFGHVDGIDLEGFQKSFTEMQSTNAQSSSGTDNNAQ